MTDADARAREIAERIVADWHGDDPPYMSGVYDDLVALIASALSTSAGYRAGIEAAARVAANWRVLFGGKEPEHVSARKWANDAVLDIEDAIRALAPPAEAVKLETSEAERDELCKNLERGDWTGQKLAAMRRDFDRLLASHKGQKDGFRADDFQAALDPLLSGNEAVIKTALSNNFNVIIAALRRAAHKGEREYVAEKNDRARLSVAQDAHLVGTGFLRLYPDGREERIPPNEIFIQRATPAKED